MLLYSISLARPVRFLQTYLCVGAFCSSWPEANGGDVASTIDLLIAIGYGIDFFMEELRELVKGAYAPTHGMTHGAWKTHGVGAGVPDSKAWMTP